MVDQLVMKVVDDKEDKVVDKVIKSLKTVHETFFFSSSFLSISRLISPLLSPTVLGSLTRSGPNQTSSKLYFYELPTFLVLSKLKICELTISELKNSWYVATFEQFPQIGNFLQNNPQM